MVVSFLFFIFSSKICSNSSLKSKKLIEYSDNQLLLSELLVSYFLSSLSCETLHIFVLELVRKSVTKFENERVCLWMSSNIYPSKMFSYLASFPTRYKVIYPTIQQDIKLSIQQDI